MRRLALLLALVGCGDAADAPRESLGAVSSAITGGTNDTADDAVVMLGRVGTSICTGTVIAPTVVATAAHCLVFPPTKIHVGSSESGGRDVPVAAVHIHPLYDGQSFAHDVGAIVLAEAASVEAVPLHDGALTDDLDGRPVRVVGFGVSDTDAGTAGTKEDGTSLVQTLESDTIKITPSPSQPCRGDSGGPVLLRDADGETLVGITSRGDDECSTYARAMRVDLVHDFFTGEIAAAAPSPAASTGCGVSRGSSTGAGGTLLFVAACLVGLRRKRHEA